MRELTERLRLIATIAARNLAGHRSKNLVIGGILASGTLLVVVGSSLLESMQREMTKSITQTLAGHLHAYSSTAPDPIALFGGGVSGQEDIGYIPDFAPVGEVIRSVPNVRAVVPMGLDSAFVSAGNDVDRIVDSLRAAARAGDRQRVEQHRDQLQEIARLLESELVHGAELSGSTADLEERRADLARVLGPDLWSALEADPEQALQFLETRIAPMLEEGRVMPLRYVGTDLDAFSRSFDRLRIIEGEPVPSGRRGLLLNARYRDEVMKHKVARDLDALREELNGGRRIADDPLLQGRVRKLSRLHRKVALQLDRGEVQRIAPILEAELPELRGQPISKLLERFLQVDDASFERRCDLFYAHVAPAIELYEVKVGDTVAVRAFTRGGQLRSVNVKVYGTFRFEGLDRSDLAGGHNLMDLMSFRDLYDLMTEEKRRELDTLRRDLVEVQGSADADAAFFGGEGALEAVEDDARPFDELAGAVVGSERSRRARLESQRYAQEEIDRGVVLDVAILLEDPDALEATRAELAEKLAPLGVQVVTWQQASGMVGQFLLLVRLVLVVAAGIIFFVALVIINNSLLLAAMERVGEIGTLLAIGASEGFVLLLFLAETTVLGLVSGGLGGALGVVLLSVLSERGIPATNNVLAFLFSGSALHPSASAAHLLLGITVILAVSVVSAMYPAFVATRISPRAAMESKE